MVHEGIPASRVVTLQRSGHLGDVGGGPHAISPFDLSAGEPRATSTEVAATAPEKLCATTTNQG
jgi:hypothetical protein